MPNIYLKLPNDTQVENMARSRAMQQVKVKEFECDYCEGDGCEMCEGINEQFEDRIIND